jgi:hypothetical protein
MFDHIKFGVSDYPASKAFFLKALEGFTVPVPNRGEAGASSLGVHGRESTASRSGLPRTRGLTLPSRVRRRRHGLGSGDGAARGLGILGRSASRAG